MKGRDKMEEEAKRAGEGNGEQKKTLTVSAEIPNGNECRYETGKPCVMARYAKRWNAYNCALHNKLLKGGTSPRKCGECLRASQSE